MAQAKKGSTKAMIQMIERFMPMLKKYSRLLGYEDAYHELVEWMIKAIKRYKEYSNEDEHNT